MKKVMYILSCIALFLSCGDKDVYKAPEVDLNLLKPYEDMEVIVPEGMPRLSSYMMIPWPFVLIQQQFRFLLTGRLN